MPVCSGESTLGLGGQRLPVLTSPVTSAKSLYLSVTQLWCISVLSESYIFVHEVA